jgi:hypothetical protein
MNKLDVCKATRKISSDTLYTALNQVLNANEAIAEVQFRDLWLKELRKYKEIFPDGWYTPPPHGIVVLFASDANPKRADFVNLRPEEYWPREDIFLNRENGYAYLFASPTNRATGLVGDFSINIYFGKDEDTKTHLKNSVKLEREIFEFIQPGMSFSDVFNFADNLITKNGLRNNIISITNPDGVNIGHTIPASYEDWTEEELESLRQADKDWRTFKNSISKKRSFLSRREDLRVMPGMAFTIEPALKNISNENIPMTMFHQVALIKENGEKELLTNFDEIFKLTGMDYMLR